VIVTKGGHIIENWGWYVGCLITKESHIRNQLQPSYAHSISSNNLMPLLNMRALTKTTLTTLITLIYIETTKNKKVILQ